MGRPRAKCDNPEIIKYVSEKCFAGDKPCRRWSICDHEDYCDGKLIMIGHKCPRDIANK